VEATCADAGQYQDNIGQQQEAEKGKILEATTREERPLDDTQPEFTDQTVSPNTKQLEK